MILGVMVLFICSGCSRPQSTSPESVHSPTYKRLEAKYPVDSKPVLLKSCLVDGADMTQPTLPIKTAGGRTLEVMGRFAPGEMGITGVTPYWNQRAGEPQKSPGHRTNLDDPKYFLSYIVSGGNPAKNAGTLESGLVENRQQDQETEFRFRVKAPNARGSYVVDIRLAGEQLPSRDGSPNKHPDVIAMWRCEMVVE